MTRRRKPRLHFPENRLAALLTRAHGRARAEAVQGGAMRLQARRAVAMARLEELIAGLEAGPRTREALPDIARDSDRIVTLAVCFGQSALADTARRLCDAAILLRPQDRFDPAALDVHIRALRLFAPDSPLLDDAQAAMVLGRIAALAAHLDTHLPHR